MPVLRTAGMHQACTPHGSRGTQYQLPLMCEPELELPSLPVSACSDLWMSRTLFRNGFVGSSGRMRQTGNQRADLKRLLGQVSAPDTFSIDDPSNCFRFPGYGLQQAETVAKILVAYLRSGATDYGQVNANKKCLYFYCTSRLIKVMSQH